MKQTQPTAFDRGRNAYAANLATGNTRVSSPFKAAAKTRAFWMGFDYQRSLVLKRNPPADVIQLTPEMIASVKDAVRQGAARLA